MEQYGRQNFSFTRRRGFGGAASGARHRPRNSTAARVIASLYQKEVREALTQLNKEFGEVDWVGVWGDGFVRSEFSQLRRRELLDSSARRAALYDDLFGNLDAAYERARLTQVIREYKPNVIVDSINTATAISYQDAYAASVIAKQKLDALFGELDALTRTVRQMTVPLTLPQGSESHVAVQEAYSREQVEHTLAQLNAHLEALGDLRKPAQNAFETLLISQACRNWCATWF